ncbi:MAG: macro domain-containing protein [Candidatus Nanoarchaeia archaeon]|nr:macro domain-containing protein [Candidatus Nanoarchaeia archaeon]
MIHYLSGDATQPIKTPAYIIHICNNLGGWGAGFVLAVTKRFGKGPESSYRLWFQSKEDFRLGQIQIVKVSEQISVVNMIAQRGFLDKDNQKPLDLRALKDCLKQVYLVTKKSNITIHMPRIGCGLAGGKWEEIEPVIQKHMTVDTYVYDL